jgi:hypothetical protein
MKKGGHDLFAEEEHDDTHELNSLLELIFIVQNHTKIERRYFVAKKEIDYG